MLHNKISMLKQLQEQGGNAPRQWSSNKEAFPSQYKELLVIWIQMRQSDCSQVRHIILRHLKDFQMGLPVAQEGEEAVLQVAEIGILSRIWRIEQWRRDSFNSLSGIEVRERIVIIDILHVGLPRLTSTKEVRSHVDGRSRDGPCCSDSMTLGKTPANSNTVMLGRRNYRSEGGESKGHGPLTGILR